MSVVWTNGENFIICPYGEKAHFISDSRFSTHVVKCRKSSNINLAICPYNSDHRLQSSEYQHHVTLCEDRFYLDLRAYEYDDDNNSETLYPIVEKKITHQYDSWDDDDDPSYNPEEYCISEEIVRRLDVEPGSVRKGFRQNERTRFQQLARLTQGRQLNLENKENNNPRDTSTTGNSNGQAKPNGIANGNSNGHAKPNGVANGNSNGHARPNGVANGYSRAIPTNANINSNAGANGISHVTSTIVTYGSVDGSASDTSSETNFPPLGSSRRTRGRGRGSRGVSGKPAPQAKGRGRRQF